MNQTDFLFAKPSFIGGLASVLDMGTTLVVYNESKNSSEADEKAIGSDWIVTGNDIRAAMGKFENSGRIE
jgi:hypothetical protein